MKNNSKEQLDAFIKAKTGNYIVRIKDAVVDGGDLGEAFSTGYPQLDSKMRYEDDLLGKGGVRGGELIIVTGRPGMGKCLHPDTPVIMFNGETKKAKHIVENDLLIGPDSLPKIVTGLASGKDQMFKITPIKGEPYIVNSNHILSLRKTGKDEIINISVSDFLSETKTFQGKYKGWRTPIDWCEQRIKVDPYFLGVWLGDGSSKDLIVTTPDKEIISFLKKTAKRERLILSNIEKRKGFCSSFRFSNSGKKRRLLEELKSYGLVPKKFIPDVYKINSRKVRLQVLAGLIDTDGFLGDNVFEIVTKFKELKDDILFLSRSLGLAAYSHEKIGEIKSIGFKGKYHRIIISGDVKEIPTRIKRKKAKKRRQRKNVLNTGIVVEPLGIGKYCGFEVSGDGLFVLGDFTVTHNTTFSQNITLNLEKKAIPTCWFTYEVSVNSLYNKFVRMGMPEDVLIYTPKKHITGNVGWISEKINEAIDKYFVKVIFIDDITFLTPKNASNEIQYRIKIDNIITDLKNIAVSKNVVIVLMVHIRKTNGKQIELEDIAESSSPAQKSDYVFVVERKDAEKNSVETTSRSRLLIKKNRPFGTLGFVNFFFDKNIFIEDNIQ